MDADIDVFDTVSINARCVWANLSVWLPFVI